MFSILSSVVIALAAVSVIANPTGEIESRQAIGQPITGGSATYYFQGGVAGACGGINPDNAAVVAEQALRYKASDCGRRVRVTNTQNGKTVDAVVADRCAGCQGNANSLDLSVYAFTQIATEAQGIVPITWEYLS